MIKIYFGPFSLVMLILAIVCTCHGDNTLVGYWNFEDGKGNDVKDVSGSGNNGTIKGKVEWKPGKIGGGMAFTKAGQGYVTISDSQTLDIAEQVTLCAWIKPSQIYLGGAWQERNCIIAKLRAYYMDISETGNLASYLYGVQPQQWLVGKTDMMKFLNTWVHVATVYDGKEHRLYINGKLDISEKKSGNITFNSDPLTIGWVDNNRYFDGLLDEVQVWSRGLSEGELSGLMAVSRNSKLPVCWSDLK